MNTAKSKTLESIEEKMSQLDEGSLRYHLLDSARSFKTSWIELGRSLYSALKDKLYKEWGYSSFDIYTTKEIGIRKDTAMKLLRSYYFLEKEEPSYLKEEYKDSANVASVPSFESVDVLRRAKEKKIDSEDYASLKKQVFQDGREAREVKKDLTSLIRQREEFEPEEARERKRDATIKRFLGTLKALKQEMELNKLLPGPLMRETESLIKKLEAEL